MAKIDQLTPKDLEGYIAKDLMASSRHMKLYTEVHFNYPKHETFFVVYNSDAIAGTHSNVKDAMDQYNELTKDIE